ncbi:hypothetical protein [Kitasatospora sp. NPDC056181]|uniref:hypothetical protein n=1 Tax=Kitasatospora sp. NPDC056181 TaxID=3345737 RepID=UPI0035E2CE5F
MVLLLIILAGPVIAFGLIGYGGTTLARRREGGARTVHGLAALAGAGAAAMYTWGALHVGMAVLDADDSGAGSAPIRPCRAAGNEKAMEVVGYEVHYLPLDFVCHVPGGRDYTADTVPGYVTPAASALGLTAVALPLSTAFAAEFRARRSRNGGPDREPQRSQ